MKNILGLIILPLCFLFPSCTTDNEDRSFSVEGLKPIYVDGLDWQQISVEAPKPVGKLGKIYYKDGLIYVNEVSKGIHIVDNNDPTNPVAIKFINVVGSKDISIKGNYLYTDNVRDLVVLDISDIENITTVNRIPNIYPTSNQSFPEFSNGYFECADPSLGTIVGWETAFLENPKCRNF